MNLSSYFPNYTGPNQTITVQDQINNGAQVFKPVYNNTPVASGINPNKIPSVSGPPPAVYSQEMINKNTQTAPPPQYTSQTTPSSQITVPLAYDYRNSPMATNTTTNNRLSNTITQYALDPAYDYNTTPTTTNNEISTYKYQTDSLNTTTNNYNYNQIPNVSVNSNVDTTKKRYQDTIYGSIPNDPSDATTYKDNGQMDQYKRKSITVEESNVNNKLLYVGGGILLLFYILS